MVAVLGELMQLSFDLLALADVLEKQVCCIGIGRAASDFTLDRLKLLVQCLPFRLIVLLLLE